MHAEDPRKFVSIAKEKARTIEEALPHLQARYGEARHRPTVRFYEGKEGIKMILEEILAEAKELLCFSSADDFFQTLDNEFPKFVVKRVQNRIPIKVILRESAKAQERKRLGQQQLREVRIIPAAYEYQSAFFIWDRKIAMFSLTGDLVALVIESGQLANAERTMFQLIWDSLESR